MPNWCENKLTVLGSPERVDAFVNAARGPGPHFKPSDFELNQWRRRCELAAERSEPIPPDPRVPSTEADALSFHALVPLPESAIGELYDPAGYNAELAMWGIKWGAVKPSLDRHEPGRADYSYKTAWGPGHKFLYSLAAKWPDITIVVSYGEEYPTRGRLVYQSDGPVTADDERADGVKCPIKDDGTDETEEASHDWWKAWEREKLATHDAFVEEVRRRTV